MNFKHIKKQGIEITKGSFSKCLKNLSFISCNIASFVDFMKSNTARPKAKRQIGKAGEESILLYATVFFSSNIYPFIVRDVAFGIEIKQRILSAEKAVLSNSPLNFTLKISSPVDIVS